MEVRSAVGGLARVFNMDIDELQRELDNCALEMDEKLEKTAGSVHARIDEEVAEISACTAASAAHEELRAEKLQEALTESVDELHDRLDAELAGVNAVSMAQGIHARGELESGLQSLNVGVGDKLEVLDEKLHEDMQTVMDSTIESQWLVAEEIRVAGAQVAERFDGVDSQLCNVNQDVARRSLECRRGPERGRPRVRLCRQPAGRRRQPGVQ